MLIAQILIEKASSYEMPSRQSSLENPGKKTYRHRDVLEKEYKAVKKSSYVHQDQFGTVLIYSVRVLRGHTEVRGFLMTNWIGPSDTVFITFQAS